MSPPRCSQWTLEAPPSSLSRWPSCFVLLIWSGVGGGVGPTGDLQMHVCLHLPVPDPPLTPTPSSMPSAQLCTGQPQSPWQHSSPICLFSHSLYVESVQTPLSKHCLESNQLTPSPLLSACGNPPSPQPTGPKALLFPHFPQPLLQIRAKTTPI